MLVDIANILLIYHLVNIKRGLYNIQPSEAFHFTYHLVNIKQTYKKLFHLLVFHFTYHLVNIKLGRSFFVEHLYIYLYIPLS
ncbi:hypothetical protein ERM86_09235 [Clostridioides difficile]|nr:hypothetical protein [Clostridioides difficile]